MFRNEFQRQTRPRRRIGYARTSPRERFAVHDLPNARVQMLDPLSFGISMAPCVELCVQDTHDLHRQSLNVHHPRQDGEYSMKTKTETDNKTVTLGDHP